MSAAVGAAGALLRYLTDLQPGGIPQLQRPVVRRADRFMWVDEMTRRNLELVEPLRSGAEGVTLLEAIDRTVTPMGARLLRSWVLSPLSRSGRDQRPARCGGEPRCRNARSREDARAALDGVRDLERLAGRAAAGPRHPARPGRAAGLVLAASSSRAALDGLACRASDGRTDGPYSRTRASQFDPLEDLSSALSAALTERPPISLADGGVIRPGLSTPSSTNCASFATAASSTSRPCRSGSANAPASPRSRSATTRSSAISSR